MKPKQPPKKKTNRHRAGKAIAKIVNDKKKEKL